MITNGRPKTGNSKESESTREGGLSQWEWDAAGLRKFAGRETSKWKSQYNTTHPSIPVFTGIGEGPGLFVWITGFGSIDSFCRSPFVKRQVYKDTQIRLDVMWAKN